MDQRQRIRLVKDDVHRCVTSGHRSKKQSNEVFFDTILKVNSWQ